MNRFIIWVDCSYCILIYNKNLKIVENSQTLISCNQFIYCIYKTWKRIIKSILPLKLTGVILLVNFIIRVTLIRFVLQKLELLKSHYRHFLIPDSIFYKNFSRCSKLVTIPLQWAKMARTKGSLWWVLTAWGFFGNIVKPVKNEDRIGQKRHIIQKCRLKEYTRNNTFSIYEG